MGRQLGDPVSLPCVPIEALQLIGKNCSGHYQPRWNDNLEWIPLDLIRDRRENREA